MCKVILFFVDKCERKEKKISVNAKNIYIHISVNARKLKSGCDIFFPSHTRIPPQKSTSLI